MRKTGYGILSSLPSHPSSKPHCHNLIELSPSHAAVLEVLIAGIIVIEDLLGQEEVVLLAEAIRGLHLSHELLVESLTHHPPGDTIHDHKGDPIL